MPKAVTENNGHKRNAKGQFALGNHGRLRALDRKKPLDLKEVAHQILFGKDPQLYIVNVHRRIMAGEAPVMEKFFAEHVFGKPKETIDLNITQTHISVLLSLSDLELGAFLEAMTSGRQEEALKLLPGNAA